MLLRKTRCRHWRPIVGSSLHSLATTEVFSREYLACKTRGMRRHFPERGTFAGILTSLIT